MKGGAEVYWRGLKINYRPFIFSIKTAQGIIEIQRVNLLCRSTFDHKNGDLLTADCAVLTFTEAKKL